MMKNLIIRSNKMRIWDWNDNFTRTEESAVKIMSFDALTLTRGFLQHFSFAVNNRDTFGRKKMCSDDENDQYLSKLTRLWAGHKSTMIAAACWFKWDRCWQVPGSSSASLRAPRPPARLRARAQLSPPLFFTVNINVSACLSVSRAQRCVSCTGLCWGRTCGCLLITKWNLMMYLLNPEFSGL